jgi:hypothetical protein
MGGVKPFGVQEGAALALAAPFLRLTHELGWSPIKARGVRAARTIRLPRQKRSHCRNPFCLAWDDWKP